MRMVRSAVAASLGIVILLLGVYAVMSSTAHAESVSWSSSNQPRVEYHYTKSKGSWLNYFMATIHYQARMFDEDTGVTINPGSTVPLGTRVRVESVPHVSTDISWFGTGGRYDSPYGDWFADASNPDPRNICTVQNFVQARDDDAMYGRLSVDPPTKTAIPIGSAFTCDAPTDDGGVTCTAVSAGTLNVNLTFEDTYGYMYLGTNDWKDVGKKHVRKCQYDSGRAELSSGGEYVLDIPAQSIPFSVTAGLVDGSPPGTPSVSPSAVTAQCLTGSPYSLVVTSIDPDNDPVRYLVDWNGDGIVDQIVPSTGYVPSGEPVVISRTFSVAGGNAVHVLASDSKGLTSGWAAEPFFCEETSNGDGDGDGGDFGNDYDFGDISLADLNLQAVPTIVLAGETTRLFWSAADVTQCEVTGSNGDGGDGWNSLVSPLDGKESSPITEQSTYTLSCLTQGGSTLTDTVTVDILPVWNED